MPDGTTGPGATTTTAPSFGAATTRPGATTTTVHATTTTVPHTAAASGGSSGLAFTGLDVRGLLTWVFVLSGTGAGLLLVSEMRRRDPRKA